MTSPDRLTRACQITVALLAARDDLGLLGDVLAAELRDVEDPGQLLVAVVVDLVTVIRTTLDQVAATGTRIDFDRAVRQLGAAVAAQAQQPLRLTQEGLTQPGESDTREPIGTREHRPPGRERAV
jgi:hypothetical protein